MHNMHNWKIWFTNNIFRLWNFFVENAIFYFLPFSFTQISKDYCQKSYNRFRGFLLTSTTSQMFLIYTKWNGGPFILFYLFVFSICTDIHFGSLFVLNETHDNLLFDDTFKMYCCALQSLKLKLRKQDLLKFRVVEYAISFFLTSYLCLF